MAPLSAQPIAQSYRAGDCRLDVLFTPSALSRWSDRPVVETLTFQLWLGCDEQKIETEGEITGGEETLIAQGDRTQLQAIAQYFQATTRNVLALSSLTTASRPASSVEPPLGLQLDRSISYLQLSDIATVLTQYEQAIRPLPVALRETVSNVIPLSSVRSAEESRPSVLPDAVRERAARNRLATTSRRSRRKTGLWASSAAAALFVVGITTTLISRDPTLQEVGITSDTPILDSQTEASRSSETAPFELSSPDPLEESAEESTERDRTSARGPNGSFPIQPEPSRLPPSRNAESPVPERTVPEQTEPNIQSSSDIPDAEVSEPTVPDPDTSVSSPAQSPDTRPETSNNEQARALPEDLSGLPQGTAEPEILPEAASPEAPPDVNADSTSRSSTARSTSESATRSTEEAFDIESLRTESAQPEGSPAAPPPASPLPTPDAATSDSETLEAPSTRLSEQIQSYFQQRLLSSGLNTVEVGPLVYRLQVSEAGEVVVFVALDDASETYRNTLLPEDSLPVFAADSDDRAVSARAFRVLFNQDGVVEVSPI